MSSNAAAAPQQKWWNGPVQGLQKVGRSLQLPVAVLPAAGLLVSLGNLFSSYLDGAFWDKTSKVLLNGGGAILDGELGLPLLFCIGVAIGFAKSPNRALIPLGMHHLLNVLPVVPGGLSATNGKHGDNCPLPASRDPAPRQFMTGFCPDHDVRPPPGLPRDRPTAPAPSAARSPAA
ncbi:hypothetical protein SBADM41S_01955 [Streptomyces badius]